MSGKTVSRKTPRIDVRGLERAEPLAVPHPSALRMNARGLGSGVSKMSGWDPALGSRQDLDTGGVMGKFSPGDLIPTRMGPVELLDAKVQGHSIVRVDDGVYSVPTETLEAEARQSGAFEGAERSRAAMAPLLGAALELAAEPLDAVLGTFAHTVISLHYVLEHPRPVEVLLDKSIARAIAGALGYRARVPRTVGRRRPDILDISWSSIYEIKPRKQQHLFQGIDALRMYWTALHPEFPTLKIGEGSYITEGRRVLPWSQGAPQQLEWRYEREGVITYQYSEVESNMSAAQVRYARRVLLALALIAAGLVVVTIPELVAVITTCIPPKRALELAAKYL
jgi:hypothetical protein